MDKRKYRSEFRETQAARRRHKVLDSARRLFETHGFEPVTIAQIAEESAVSASTVYSLFKSKRGVLLALLEEAFPEKEFEILVRRVTEAPSVEARLQASARVARRLLDAEFRQIGALGETALLAPELKEHERRREAMRYAAQERTIAAISAEGRLAQELTHTKARDILWGFTGRSFYRMFVLERGWSSDEYEEFLGQLLISTLLLHKK